MPPAINQSKKLAVRIALATGSTFATIIGAQSLAVQSETPQTDSSLEPAVAGIQPADNNNVKPPEVNAPHTAPRLTILRAGPTPTTPPLPFLNEQNAAQPSMQQQARQIVPPQPMALQAPAPLVVQPDPVVIQPPPIIVQAPSSGGGDDNDHGGGGGGGSHSSPRSSSS